MSKCINYGDLIIQFRDNLHALKTFVDHVEPVLESQIIDCFKNDTILPLVALLESKTNTCKFDDKVMDDLKKLESLLTEKAGFQIIDDGDNISFKLNNTNFSKKLSKGLHQIKIGQQQDKILYESSLINLIIYFELLLGGLLRKRLCEHPEASGIQNKSLPLEEIRKLGSLENAEDYLIEKEVENTMRGSFDEWRKFFNTKTKLRFDFLKDDEPEINEIFQSRNLLVHNGGVVNNIYISNVESPYKKELGSSLDIGKKYLNKAINTLERIGLIIALEIWKNEEKNSDERPDYISDVAFEYLENEQWIIAKHLYKFILSEKSISSRLKLQSQMNYWQSMKWSGEYDKIKDEIIKQDFSDKQELFQLCLFAIKDEYEQFFKLLPSLIPNTLDIDSIKTWPIFREIRTRPEYDDFIERSEESTPTKKSKAKISRSKKQVGAVTSNEQEAKIS